MAHGHSSAMHNGHHDIPQPSSSTASSVPDIPGRPADATTQANLRSHVANLTGAGSHHHPRFPGAQPVSFTKASLDLLRNEDFWVCEKSDGQRVLILVVFNAGMNQQEVFLIDRKNNYYHQQSVFFPHSEKAFYPKGSPTDKEAAFRRAAAAGVPYNAEGWPVRKDTLLDGELVWDVDRNTGQRRMRLLLFDALVVDGTNMAARPLTKRYGRLHTMVYPPLMDYLRQNSAVAAAMPFEIKIKHMDLAYGIEAVLSRMPHLEHGNDGLIFTSMHSGYTFSTDPKIIKWKPPNENSIDFLLRLRFPPDPRVAAGNVPDLKAKPLFLLEEYMGDGRGADRRESMYEPFDWAWVEDEEWEDMKRSGLQFDDRVVECVWDPQGGPPLDDVEGAGGAGSKRSDQALEDDGNEREAKRSKLSGSNGDGSVGALAAPRRAPAWRIHRIRDDKRDGNHHSIVQKILLSIVDGVEEAEVVASAAEMRSNWKTAARENLRKAFDQGKGNVAGITASVPASQAIASTGAAAGGRRGSIDQPEAAGSTRNKPLPIPIGPLGIRRI